MWSPSLLFAGFFVGFAAAAVESFARRVGGDQAVAAGADQILPAGLLQGPADFEIILRLEELQQGPLQFPVAQMLRRASPASA